MFGRAARLAALAALAAAPAACVSSSNPSSDAAVDAPILEIRYIAHAAFAMRAADGTELLIDPYASRVWLGYDFPASYLGADVVAITHPHYDHDFGEFIGREAPWTSEQQVLRDAGSFSAGGFALTGVAGKHADPYGTEFGQKNVIWIVEAGGLRVVHAGDNGPLSEEVAAALGRVDVLMLPIDGNEHILTYDQIDAIRARLAPRVIIPMHYRLGDLESDPSSPEDLGPVDPWLDRVAGELTVDRRGASAYEISASSLPAAPAVVVLDHAADVPPAP